MKNISTGKLAHTNTDSEQTANGICILMWPQNALYLFKDIKFPVDKRLSLKTTTLTCLLSFPASWKPFTGRITNICGMILKQKMPLDLKPSLFQYFSEILKAFSGTKEDEYLSVSVTEPRCPDSEAVPKV